MGKYRELLIRAKSNDTEAVAELYQQYQAMIIKYSYIDGKIDEDGNYTFSFGDWEWSTEDMETDGTDAAVNNKVAHCKMKMSI